MNHYNGYLKAQRQYDAIMPPEPKIKYCEQCSERLEEKEEYERGVCDKCNKLTACCGVDYDEDIGICPKCKEHV